MKILINVGKWGSLYIVLPVEHAPLAAGLLANATIYEDDGTTSDGKHYKLSKDGELSIAYAHDNQFEALPQAILDARKNAEEASSARWKAEDEKRELQKKLDEATAALAALQSVTVCQTIEPEPEPAKADEEE